MDPGRCLDELPGYADASRCLPYAAFKHKTHTEFAADLFDVNRSSFVGKARVSGDHKQPTRFGKSSDDVLRDSVCEVLLFRIATHVLESKDRNRRFVRQFEHLR